MVKSSIIALLNLLGILLGMIELISMKGKLMKEIPNLNQAKINAFIKDKNKKKISDGMVRGLLLEKPKQKLYGA